MGGACRKEAGATLWLAGRDFFHVESEKDTVFSSGGEGGGGEEASFSKAESAYEVQDHKCEGMEVLGGGAFVGEGTEALQGKPRAWVRDIEV